MSWDSLVFNENKILNLNQSYDFDVLVDDNGKKFSGKLLLTPDKCTLRVMGERTLSNNFFLSSELKCSSFRQYFWLFDLNGISLSTRHIDECLSFFECVFEVGFIVSSDSNFSSDSCIESLSIEAPMIKKWVGMTNIQDTLVKNFYSNKLSYSIDDSSEVLQPIDEYGIFLVDYKLESYQSLRGFSSGIRFPPRLSIIFNPLIEMRNLKYEFNNFYELMSFFIGSDFEIEAIEFSMNKNMFSEYSCVYFSQTNRTREREYPLFPLGRNLIRNDLSLPELPLNSISQYFNLDKNNKASYSKYLRYKRMKSKEEQFLGYFRLLEKHTIKLGEFVTPDSLDGFLYSNKDNIHENLIGKKKDISNFVKRIKRINTSKYNTDKCITDFYKSLPENLRKKIALEKGDITKVCKLRNDITHANEYSICDNDLYKYTVAIDKLLYLVLLAVIGIQPRVTLALIDRITR